MFVVKRLSYDEISQYLRPGIVTRYDYFTTKEKENDNHYDDGYINKATVVFAKISNHILRRNANPSFNLYSLVIFS